MPIIGIGIGPSFGLAAAADSGAPPESVLLSSDGQVFFFDGDESSEKVLLGVSSRTAFELDETFEFASAVTFISGIGGSRKVPLSELATFYT